MTSDIRNPIETRPLANGLAISLQGRLHYENLVFRGTGGLSQENREWGFRPAFLDSTTHRIYLSRYADGRPAPLHLLGGLPEELIVSRGASGSGMRVKDSLIAGFVRAGKFYTREQAATYSHEDPLSIARH